MRRAFTLIEMMISVAIFSLIMLFLYESYTALNRSNVVYEKKAQNLAEQTVRKSVLFLDFFLAEAGSIQILNQEKNEDVVFLQSSNSLHRRIYPYIAYVVKEKKLYRLESLKAFLEYPLVSDSDFTVDYLGKVDGFRVYKNTKKEEGASSENYLIHVDFTQDDDILLKAKVFNED